MINNKEKRTVYNKLIRDKIPEIIAKSGKSFEYLTVSGDEFIELLNKKLLEEVDEYLENSAIEELADILEVIYAILEINNISIDDLEQIRLNKLKTRGGFKKRFLLREVIE